ncbi:MAG TPA: cation:proton antiporter, partial [Alicycliphilus sp.]|nr:cation:proton antiporter [Alicycliphilus sp.]
HLASHAAVLSSGTLLAAAGFGQNLLTAGLLYYLPSSTLAVAALFLLADLIERWRNHGATLAPYEKDEDAPFLSPELVPGGRLKLDDDEEVLVGRVIPAATAFLGLAYLMSALVIAGLPPLSGFVGKFAMLTALLNPLGLGASTGVVPGLAGWALLALMIGTGLLALLALTRSGIRHFWASQDRGSPQLRVLEGLPVALLLGACIVLTLQAEGVMRFTTATANALHAPGGYIRAVLTATPRPSPAPEAAP